MACSFQLAFFFIALAALFCSSAFSYSSPVSFPAVSFGERFSQLFGDGNLVVHDNGKNVRISLDERTGSGFASQDRYLHGWFSSSIKLPDDYTAGVVVAFYMSNGDLFDKNHDEIDFEFLGNIRGRSWRVQTNIYGNGSTSIGREERCKLWFDPTEDFHNYSILWTDSLIVFFVDNVPIREVRRTAAMGGDFPSKPMSLYATIWDASGWATNGGKYKVNYGYAPYVAEFSNLVPHGCHYNLIDMVTKCNRSLTLGAVPRALSRPQRLRMQRFRAKHLTYSFCYDQARYRSPPPECIIFPREAVRLRSHDPVTFGALGTFVGRRHHQNRSRGPRGHISST